MRDSNEHNHEIEVPLTETEEQMAEVLQEFYDVDSFSELMSEIAAERTGDIHPDALANGEVDISALVEGDLDPNDVPAEYKIGNYEPDGKGVSDDV